MPADADLLDRLGRGDVAATDQLFRAYSPYLRAVVRRQLSPRLRARFDSADVVQSVWVQVVKRLGRDGLAVANEDFLRALLAVIARRRLVGRVRKHAASESRRRPAPPDAPPAPGPTPSEEVQADDLWDKMLAACPPEHRPILRLRREGLLLHEIAARTGLHEGSVRRVLRQLARDLALREKPLRGTPSS